MTKLEKFVIGAVGGLAPSIIMLSTGGIVILWNQISFSEAFDAIFTTASLAGLTGFVTTLYNEKTPLKLFWVGVTLPSLVLNLSADHGAPQAFIPISVPVVYAQTTSPTEIEGPLSNLSGTCFDLRFAIDGTRVTTEESTDFDGLTCQELRNGLLVEVEGLIVFGEFLASEVNVRDDVEGVVLEVRGACPDRTFVVEGIEIVTNSDTTFESSTRFLNDPKCEIVTVGATLDVDLDADGLGPATRVDILSRPQDDLRGFFVDFWNGMRRALGRLPVYR